MFDFFPVMVLVMVYSLSRLLQQADIEQYESSIGAAADPTGISNRMCCFVISITLLAWVGKKFLLYSTDEMNKKIIC